METEEFSTKSRVRGDFQARFCEKGRVKFPPTYSTKISNHIKEAIQYFGIILMSMLSVLWLLINHKRIK